ncbi:MAG: hypothetical protein ACRD8Z_25145 [Nitrososphaeraceae archaeon]
MSRTSKDLCQASFIDSANSKSETRACQRQEKILCRRSKIIELRSREMSERKIAEVLGIPWSTIGQDLRVLKRQAALNIQIFVERGLPHEANLHMENANVLLSVAWSSLEKDLEAGKAPLPLVQSFRSLT